MYTIYSDRGRMVVIHSAVEPNKSSSDDGVARALRCKPSGSGLEFGSHLCVCRSYVLRVTSVEA